MRVLVAGEFSGVVREAFRSRGHDAWSCDLVPALDKSPYHFQGDVRQLLYPELAAAGKFRRLDTYQQVPSGWYKSDGKPNWDLMIAHPNCDRLLVAGALHWREWQESGDQQRGIVFFMEMALAPIPKVAVENPTGIISSCWRKYDQRIQPHEFGDPEQKGICLWLMGLPKLKPTKNVYDEMMKLPKRVRERVFHESPGVKNGLTRSQRRSIFFPGIANAMAEQWGNDSLRKD